jgi:Ca2+-binding RTX toxin-like protein
MSRRAPILLAAIAVMVALFATAAYAAVIDGTGKSDILYESNTNDTIEGKGNPDWLRAQQFTNDEDNLDGGTGIDTLNARDADSRDTLDGGPGFDTCKGDPEDAYKNCERTNP